MRALALRAEGAEVVAPLRVLRARAPPAPASASGSSSAPSRTTTSADSAAASTAPRRCPSDLRLLDHRLLDQLLFVALPAHAKHSRERSEASGGPGRLLELAEAPASTTAILPPIVVAVCAPPCRALEEASEDGCTLRLHRLGGSSAATAVRMVVTALPAPARAVRVLLLDDGRLLLVLAAEDADAGLADAEAEAQGEQQAETEENADDDAGDRARAQCVLGCGLDRGQAGVDDAVGGTNRCQEGHGRAGGIGGGRGADLGYARRQGRTFTGRSQRGQVCVSRRGGHTKGREVNISRATTT